MMAVVIVFSLICKFYNNCKLCIIFKQLPDNVVRRLCWDKMRSNLSNIRRQTFPPCQSPRQFATLFDDNARLRDLFGTFRGRDFYQASIRSHHGTSSIFVIQQLVDYLPPDPSLYFDGTFCILPVKFKQLLVIFAEINGELQYMQISQTMQTMFKLVLRLKS